MPWVERVVLERVHTVANQNRSRGPGGNLDVSDSVGRAEKVLHTNIFTGARCPKVYASNEVLALGKQWNPERIVREHLIKGYGR